MLEVLETLRPVITFLDLPLSAAVAFISMRVTGRFLEFKPGWWRLVLLFVVHLGVMNAIVYVGDAAAPLVMVPLFVGSLCLFCKGKMIARVSIGLILVLLPLSINSLLTNIRPPFDFLLYVYIFIVWAGIGLFVNKALPRGVRPPIRSGRLWALVDLLALMPLGSAFTVVALTEHLYTHRNPDPFNDPIYIQNERALLIVLGLAAVAALGLLVALVVLAKHERLEQAETLWQIRSQYYGNLEQGQQQVRRLRHDMANHLTAMAGLDDTGMRAYLDKLMTSPAMSTGRRYCENEVVNAVLAAKVPLMEEREIKNDLSVQVPAGLVLADVDLCALIANSLDNAIEACSKLPAPQRAVSLEAVAAHGFFVLELKNSMEGVLLKEGGQIVTTKGDRNNHGFGLASMREIAQRYEGTLEVEATEREFRMLVSIPLAAA